MSTATRMFSALNGAAFQFFDAGEAGHLATDPVVPLTLLRAGDGAASWVAMRWA